MTDVRLASTTSPRVRSRPLVLVPVGSLEQHGSHLPLDTDTVIAAAVADAAAAVLTSAADRPGEVLVAPPIAYGASGEHQSFAGTSSIGGEALLIVLVELVRSMQTWSGPVAFVNGHGGNVAALTKAVGQLRSEGHDVGWYPCRAETGDLHAGRTETALMLRLDPARVRLADAVAGDLRPLAEILDVMQAGGVAAVSGNGVLGDPAGATAAEGELVLAAMVDRVVRDVRAAHLDQVAPG